MNRSVLWMAAVAAVCLLILICLNQTGSKEPPFDSSAAETPDSPLAEQVDVSTSRRPETSPAAPAFEPSSAIEVTNSRFQRIVAGDATMTSLDPQQIQAYLERTGFSAESLLTAFHASGDTNHLLLAATNHPNDPRIQLAIIAHGLLPEQREQWMEAFKQSAPENALPNYLLARERLKQGRLEQAFQELDAAARKSQFHDYTIEAVQAREELFMQAGYFPAEAKLAGMAGVLLPHLRPLRDLAQDLTALQQNYVASQDRESATALAGAATRLGRELNPDRGAINLLNQLIGIRIERDAIEKLEGGAAPDFLGQTVESRLTELTQQREQVRSAARHFDSWLRTANEIEVINYFDRMKLYGEPAAIAWLQTRAAVQ